MDILLNFEALQERTHVLPTHRLEDDSSRLRIPAVISVKSDSDEQSTLFTAVTGTYFVNSGEPGKPLNAFEVVLRIHRVLVRETGEWCPVSGIECNLNEDLRWAQKAIEDQVSKIRQTDYAIALFSLVKTLAEYSRGCAQIFRQQRYGIEGNLAAEFKEPTSANSTSALITCLIELNIAVSQTRDLTSDSHREGFNAWKIDSNLYHFYRRHRDPSIIYNRKALTPPDPSLIQLYDSAVRHMEGLENLCKEEIAAVEATLSTAATVAVNNEAQTQSTFNTVLSVAAIILGIPALFLALYSAGNIVPLRTSQQLVAFSPVGISIVLAGIILVWKRKFISKTLLALASLVILGLAAAMLIFAIIAPAAP